MCQTQNRTYYTIGGLVLEASPPQGATDPNRNFRTLLRRHLNGQFGATPHAGDGGGGCVAWEPSTGFLETHGHFAAWEKKTPERQMSSGGVCVIAYLVGNCIETYMSRRFWTGFDWLTASQVLSADA